MKKTLSFTVGLMLLLFTTHCCRASSGVAVDQKPPEKCCFDLFPSHIPRDRIASISTTDIRCPIPAYVITTKRGKEFCVRRDAPWAQRAYEELNPSTTSSPSSSDVN